MQARGNTIAASSACRRTRGPRAGWRSGSNPENRREASRPGFPAAGPSGRRGCRAASVEYKPSQRSIMIRMCRRAFVIVALAVVSGLTPAAQQRRRRRPGRRQPASRSARKRRRRAISSRPSRSGSRSTTSRSMRLSPTPRNPRPHEGRFRRRRKASRRSCPSCRSWTSRSSGPTRRFS